MHAARLQAADDLLQQLLRVVRVVTRHHRGGLGGHAAAQVELDGPHVVALLLHQLTGLLLLLRAQEPLQVEVLQLHQLRVILALGKADRLVVLVEVLVHRQRLVQLVVIEEDRLGALEVLGQHRHLRLRHVVVGAVAAHLGGVVLHHAVDLVKVAALGDVAQHRVAPLGDWEVEVVHGLVGQRAPHRLRLGRQRQLLEEVHCLCVRPPLQARAEGDQPLVELVLHHVHTLIDDDAGAAVRPLDVLDVALDLVQRHAVGRVDRVPHAQVASVLRHHDVAIRNPLHVVAVVQQRHALLRLHVEEVQLAALVAEEQAVRAVRVELQPVDPRVVRDRGQRLPLHQVGDANGHEVEQVGDHLRLLLLLPIGVGLLRGGDADADEVRRHVLRAGASEHLVAAVLHEGELAGLEDHADRRVVEEELLVACGVPWDLGEAAGLQVAQQQALGSGRHQESLLEDVDLLDLEADIALQHNASPSGEALHNDLAQRDVGKLVRATVA
mmetsp:Transcript_26671/g.67757  ORF Transcript_26671/g.67757 Transcript_26671/m.67757 type:complete len:496 (+) Transcript_26671:2993-4480(+)